MAAADARPRVAGGLGELREIFARMESLARERGRGAAAARADVPQSAAAPPRSSPSCSLRSDGREKPREPRIWRFDAPLKNQAGDVVGAIWGGTVCWYPRKPSKFASIGQDGAESTLRCRECPGCREFERIRLARDRLAAHYGKSRADLWVVEVCAAAAVDSGRSPHLQRGEQSAALAERRAIDRLALRLRLKLRYTDAHHSLLGWSRAGAGAVRFLVSGEFAARTMRRLAAALGASRPAVRQVRRRRGAYTRRSFRRLTAGMLVARDEYGEQRNRFYFRGLPAAPAPQRRQVSTRGGIAERHSLGRERAWSVRGWKNGVTLELPQAFAIRVRRPRRDARRGTTLLERERERRIARSALESLGLGGLNSGLDKGGKRRT